MNDREFLTWLRARLILVYRESPGIDFVRKLTAIINDYPPDKTTPNLGESPNFPPVALDAWTGE
jgi:hypothetical protein